MLIKTNDLEFSLRKAKTTSEAYNLRFLDRNNTIRSIDNLVNLVKSEENKPIDILLMDLTHSGQAVRSLYVAYDNKYDIILLEGQNPCWNRFTLCKELFHVLLDADEYRNINVDSQVDEVMNTFYVNDSEPNQSATSEKLAEIAAMEFLFPYTSRKIELQSDVLEFRQIAEKYKIPQVLVEQYLSTSYIEALNEAI